MPPAPRLRFRRCCAPRAIASSSTTTSSTGTTSRARSLSSGPASSASSSGRRSPASASKSFSSAAAGTWVRSATRRCRRMPGARSSASSISKRTPMCAPIQRDGDSVRVSYRDSAGQDCTADVDFVIAATGRTPNVRGLSLESTSLAPRRARRSAVRPQHDAMRGLRHIHRRRCQRRPAAPARSGRRGPHRGRKRGALSRRAARVTAHAARHRVLRPAARRRRDALRRSRAGHVRHRRSIVRGPGPQPRHAAQRRASACLRRYRQRTSRSAPK